MLKFSWHFFLTTAFLVLALVAGAVNLARAAVHGLEGDWNYWVELARTQAGISLAAEVAGDGLRWHPRIVLRDLRLVAPDGVFSSDYVEVRVNLLHSLWTRSLSLRHLEVRGCQLSLPAALRAPATGAKAWGGRNLLRRLSLSSYDLRNCRLNFEGARGAQARFSIERALAGPLEGQAWHSSWRGGVFMRSGIGRSAPSFHAPTLHVYSRGIQSGQLWRRTATLAVAFDSPQLMLRLGGAELAITDVAGTVDGFRARRGGWHGSMRGLRFQHLGQLVQVPSMPMASPNAGSYSALLHSIDLGALAGALAKAGLLEAMGAPGPERLRIGGTVTELRLSLDNSRPGLPPLPELELHFEDLHAIPLANGLPGFAGVSGELAVVPGLVWARLAAEPMQAWVPPLYGEHLRYQSLAATLFANFYEDVVLVEMPSVELRMAHGEGVVSAKDIRMRLQRSGALTGLSGQVVIRELEFVELMNHMPLVAFNEVLPEWFATGTSAGVLRELSVDMALDKPQDIFDAANQLHIEGDYHGWDLMIIKGLIFDNLSGKIHVDGVRAEVTMDYEAMELFRAPMPGGEGVLRTTDSSWALSIASPYARAVFTQNYGAEQIYGHCEYVHLPNLLLAAHSTVARITTTAMRTFRPSRLLLTEDTVWVPVTVDSFHMGEYDLGAWRFDVHAGVRKMLVENMYADKDGIRLRNSAADGTGAQMVQWLDDDGWTTLLEVGLEMPDMAVLFEQLDMSPLVTGKNGHLLATVSWPGELSDFDLQTLRGDIRFEMGRGEFPDVERPGILKVIGLLNFNNILRGLLPSLRSLASHGLHFKGVQARAFLADGILRLDPGYGATIDANEGAFVLRGDADLAAGTLDGKLDVTLYLAENLPLMALIAASGIPLIFAGTWLASRIAGSGVNRLARVVYTLKGPWSDLQLGKPQDEPPKDEPQPDPAP